MYPDHPNGAQPQDAPQVPGSTAYQTVTPPPAGYGPQSAIYRPKKKSFVGIIVAIILIVIVLVAGIVGFLMWDKSQQEAARQRAEAARLAAEAAKPKVETVLLNQQTKLDATTVLELTPLPSGWREVSVAAGLRTIGNPATSELVMYGVAAPVAPQTCKSDYECTRTAADVAEQSLKAQPTIKEVTRAAQDTVKIKVSDTKNVEFQHVRFTYAENGIAKVFEWYERVTPTMIATVGYTRDARASDTSTKLLEQFVIKGSV